MAEELELAVGQVYERDRARVVVVNDANPIIKRWSLVIVEGNATGPAPWTVLYSGSELGAVHVLETWTYLGHFSQLYSTPPPQD